MKILFFLLFLFSSSALASDFGFNGTTGEVHETTSITVAITNPYTISCWTNRVDYGGNGGGRINDSEGAPATHSNAATWLVRTATSSFNIISIWDNSTGEWSMPTADAPVNEWHHVTWTYNPTLYNVQPIGYIDDVSKTVTTVSALLSNAGRIGTAITFNWGNRDSDKARGWNGKLANCCYWITALSASQVRSVMHYGCNAVRQGLVVNYPFGSYGGNDYSGNGYAAASTTGGTLEGGGPPINQAPGGRWAW